MVAIALESPVRVRGSKGSRRKFSPLSVPSHRLSVYATKYCRRFVVCRLSVTWSEWYCDVPSYSNGVIGP